MNRKNTILTAAAGAVCTVAAVAATAASTPALAASAVPTVVQHFEAKGSSSPLMTSKSSYVVTDKDVQNGKTIGHDVLFCTHGSGASRCHVAFAQKGGLLYASFSLSDKTGALKGTVNGGTGAYVHAKGTLSGQAVSASDVKIGLRYKK